MRRVLAAAALLLAGALGAGAGMAEYRLVAFTDLRGWAQDHHDAALEVFRTTCDRLRGAEWGAICALAATVPEGGARVFFEHFFQPVIVDPQEVALFTGYFEPELEGAVIPDARFRYPIYARPPDLPRSGPWHTRSEIEAGLLAGRGLELAWLENPVDVFFLQVQGSGRIRLPDGSVLRLGY
ncbi:MAG: murein transglycosylase, partial [Deltaproteobacteria bacterium HGW-Deltaproteobacteria-20]